MRFYPHSTIFVLVFALVITPVFSQDNPLVRAGIVELQAGKISEAAETFNRILNDIDLAPVHSDAMYWLVKTWILLEKYEEASQLAENFLAFYPNDPRVTEIKYQRGRLMLFLGHGDKAIIALGEFVLNHPGSQLIPAARYWIGESMMAIGRLEDAKKVFNDLIESYPTSVKLEPSRYRVNEITFLEREGVLLDLLRWSHEERLKESEEFYKRELEYQDALKSGGTKPQPVDVDGLMSIEKLLESKNKLLDIKEFYINEILEIGNEYK